MNSMLSSPPRTRGSSSETRAYADTGVPDVTTWYCTCSEADIDPDFWPWRPSHPATGRPVEFARRVPWEGAHAQQAIHFASIARRRGRAEVLAAGPGNRAALPHTAGSATTGSTTSVRNCSRWWIVVRAVYSGLLTYERALASDAQRPSIERSTGSMQACVVGSDGGKPRDLDPAPSASARASSSDSLGWGSLRRSSSNVGPTRAMPAAETPDGSSMLAVCLPTGADQTHHSGHRDGVLGR